MDYVHSRLFEVIQLEVLTIIDLLVRDQIKTLDYPSSLEIRGRMHTLDYPRPNFRLCHATQLKVKCKLGHLGRDQMQT